MKIVIAQGPQLTTRSPSSDGMPCFTLEIAIGLARIFLSQNTPLHSSKYLSMNQNPPLGSKYPSPWKKMHLLLVKIPHPWEKISLPLNQNTLPFWSKYPYPIQTPFWIHSQWTCSMLSSRATLPLQIEIVKLINPLPADCHLSKLNILTHTFIVYACVPRTWIKKSCAARTRTHTCTLHSYIVFGNSAVRGFIRV